MAKSPDEMKQYSAEMLGELSALTGNGDKAIAARQEWHNRMVVHISSKTDTFARRASEKRALHVTCKLPVAVDAACPMVGDHITGSNGTAMLSPPRDQQLQAGLMAACDTLRTHFR